MKRLIDMRPGSGINGFSLAGKFDRWIDATAHLPPRMARRLVGLGLALTVGLDFATGPLVWLGPLYLLLICLATWSLNFRSGVIVAFACLAASMAVNGHSVYPFKGVVLAWNVATRAFAILGIIVLVAGFRRSYDREWRSARVDQLTGALTRKAFLEEVRASGTGGNAGVLAYLDLDSFKAINDKYGHAAGDDLLRKLSQFVLRHLSVGDRYGRVGGDEFLIYLAVKDEKSSQESIDAVHQRINAELRQSQYGGGCSMGAIFIDSEAPVSEADVARADKLMYRAKVTPGSLVVGPRYTAADLLPDAAITAAAAENRGLKDAA